MIYKPYPLDYVDGKLLVDPQKMIKSAFEGTGVLVGFCVARYIEKTWIRFKVTGLTLKGVAYGLLGGVPLYMLLVFGKKSFGHLLGVNWGRLTWDAAIIIYIVALYPLVIKWLYSKKLIHD